MSSGGMRTALRLLGIGWYVALCIAGGTLGGFWLDRLAETSPALTLAGLGLGIAVAVVGMMKMLMALFTPESREGSD